MPVRYVTFSMTMGAQGSLSASAHIHDSMRKCGVNRGPWMEKGMGVKAPPATRTPPPDIRGRVRGLGMRPGMRGAGLSNIEKKSRCREESPV